MARRASSFAASLVLALLARSVHAQIQAAAARGPIRSVPALSPIALPMTAPPSLTPSLAPSLLAPSVVAAPTVIAASIVVAAPSAVPPPQAAVLPALTGAAAAPALLPARRPAPTAHAAPPQDLKASVHSSRAGIADAPRPDAPPEYASSAAAELFDGTAGRPSSLAASAGPSSPKPSGLAPAGAPDPASAKGVRLMIAGTAAMKTGMETVTLSVPVLVLQGLGGAALVAGLVVVYGVAQAVFSGAAGGLIDRYAPQKVLAGAVLAQAGLVAGLIALGAAGALGAGVLLPLYVLIGGAVGIAETARQSIPARLLGADGPALARYNARLHIFYESAGVAGALAAGALMAAFGPLWALLIQPPAYLLGAWLFSRVRVPALAPAAPKAGAASPGLGARAAEYWADVKAGAGLVLKNGRLRWIALAFILPQIVHRVFENLLLPVYAKTALGHAGWSAYLLTASNLGELVGATLLLRLAARIPAPVWVKRGALGLALSWALVFTHSLPLLLPLILAFSMTWSSSDLSLRAEIQASLSEKELPRATSFLYGVFVLGAAAASLGMGSLLDHFAPASALPWICGAFTALGAAVYLAARRLRAR